ncbi:MAG: L-threonylcarbamoyladenylate synthase, partial [Acidobacteriota bacterium]
MKHWSIAARPADFQLSEIAATLTNGGVVLLPTDTIYGLHALWSNPAAIERIARMKGRDAQKPFLLLAASVAQIETMGIAVPPGLAAIWPAALTAILPNGSSTTAARVPDVAWLRRLLERTGPLASTSANRSGEPAITSPHLLAPELTQALDGLVDGGVR